MPTPATHVDRVYELLRGDILAGHFAPGERLKFAELQTAYQASAGTAREALTRLAEQGLVVAKPQSGYSVWPLSLPDLQDLTALRKDIEGLALTYAMARADLAWHAQLVGAHHVLEQTPQFGSDPETGAEQLRDEWAIAHKEFHRTLLAGCGNRRLLDFSTSLRTSIDLYLRWACPAGNEQARDVVGEHREILDAVLARDEAGALSALSCHIQGTANLLLSGFSSDGVYLLPTGAELPTPRRHLAGRPAVSSGADRT